MGWAVRTKQIRGMVRIELSSLTLESLLKQERSTSTCPALTPMLGAPSSTSTTTTLANRDLVPCRLLAQWFDKFAYIQGP